MLQLCYITTLLVIDEWLVSDMFDSELNFLFELFECRSNTTSTIFCTQYRQEDWVTRLNESVQAVSLTAMRILPSGSK